MNQLDRKNIGLFLSYCELDGDLEPDDKDLFDCLSECIHRFKEIEESNEPELVKAQQFNEWDQQNKPFFESLNERVCYLTSPAYLDQGEL